jgi:hypothetical protein
VSYGKVEGTGLGLVIAKKIVEDHGGEIYLDARSETGTLFRITIPFAIPKRASPEAGSSIKSSTRTLKRGPATAVSFKGRRPTFSSK